MNRRVPESKSGALPLGDIPITRILYHALGCESSPFFDKLLKSCQIVRQNRARDAKYRGDMCVTPSVILQGTAPSTSRDRPLRVSSCRGRRPRRPERGHPKCHPEGTAPSTSRERPPQVSSCGDGALDVPREATPSVILSEAKIPICHPRASVWGKILRALENDSPKRAAKDLDWDFCGVELLRHVVSVAKAGYGTKQERRRRDLRRFLTRRLQKLHPIRDLQRKRKPSALTDGQITFLLPVTSRTVAFFKASCYNKR